MHVEWISYHFPDNGPTQALEISFDSVEELQALLAYINSRVATTPSPAAEETAKPGDEDGGYIAITGWKGVEEEQEGPFLEDGIDLPKRPDTTAAGWTWNDAGPLPSKTIKLRDGLLLELRVLAGTNERRGDSPPFRDPPAPEPGTRKHKTGRPRKGTAGSILVAITHHLSGKTTREIANEVLKGQVSPNLVGEWIRTAYVALNVSRPGFRFQDGKGTVWSHKGALNELQQKWNDMGPKRQTELAHRIIED